MAVLGSVFGVLALALAPESVVAPISSFVVIFTALLSPSTGHRWGYIAGLVGSCFALVLFAPAASLHVSEDQVVYVLCIGSVCTVATLLLIRPVHSFWPGALAPGCVGGFTSALAKMATNDGHPWRAVCALAALLLAVAQQAMLNAALERYPATRCNAAYMTALMCSSAIVGATLLDEWREATAGQIGGGVVCLVCAGVCTWRIATNH